MHEAIPRRKNVTSLQRLRQNGSRRNAAVTKALHRYVLADGLKLQSHVQR